MLQQILKGNKTVNTLIFFVGDCNNKRSITISCNVIVFLLMISYQKIASTHKCFGLCLGTFDYGLAMVHKEADTKASEEKHVQFEKNIQ